MNPSNEFINGIWFCVQNLVIVRDLPIIAAEIIKESGLSTDDCIKAQKRSGSFNEQMGAFIEIELS